MKSSSEFCDSHAKFCLSTVPVRKKYLSWNEEFSGDRVAENFFSAAISRCHVGNCAAAHPNMGKLVHQRKKPRGRCVCGVDENNGSTRVADGKSTKLADLELAMGVVAHNAAAHDKNAHALGRFDEFLEVDLPGPLALFKRNIQNASDISGDLGRRRIQAKATHEGQGGEAMVLLVLEVPLLPLQRNSHRIKEINAWLWDRRVTHRPEVGQWKKLRRWFLKKQVSKGGVKCVRQVLGLTKCRAAFSCFPSCELCRFNIRAFCGTFKIKTSTLACPAQQRRVDKCLGRHGARIRDAVCGKACPASLSCAECRST